MLKQVDVSAQRWTEWRERSIVAAGASHVRREVDMATTGRDRIEAARQAVTKISNDQVQKHLASGTPIVILDVREKEEWEEGHIPQATLLPRGRLEGRVEQVVPDRNALIVTH
jgi:predicted sulfurtransferase